MAIILTTSEKLEVYRRRLNVLRQVYGDLELTLELQTLDPTTSDSDETMTRKNLAQVGVNITFISGAVEALEQARLDEAVDG